MIKNVFCAGSFGFVRLFAILLMSPKGLPSIFFYFAKEWMFKNCQRAHFTFFGTMRLNEDQKIRNVFQFFPKVGTVEDNT